MRQRNPDTPTCAKGQGGSSLRLAAHLTTLIEWFFAAVIQESAGGARGPMHMRIQSRMLSVNPPRVTVAGATIVIEAL